MSVAIVDYRPDHAAAWARLNEAWLAEGGFAIEAKDRRSIDDPHGVFIAGGGRIFIAERDGEAVGCCALIRIPDGFEVSKMTVTPAAREAEAKHLYLETNSALTPAIALYESVGFLHLPARATPYARADVFMEKRL